MYNFGLPHPQRDSEVIDSSLKFYTLKGFNDSLIAVSDEYFQVKASRSSKNDIRSNITYLRI